MLLIVLALEGAALSATPASAQPATPAEPAPVPYAKDEPRPASPKTPVGTIIKGMGGAYYAQLFDIPTYGAEASLAVGPFVGRHSNYLAFDFQHGRTQHGLSVTSWHVGVSTEWAFGRVRVGGTARLGELWLEHVTDQDTDWSVSIGVAAHASVDVVSFSGEDALFLVATLRADLYDAPLVWGPSLCVGYRWDFLSRR